MHIIALPFTLPSSLTEVGNLRVFRVEFSGSSFPIVGLPGGGQLNCKQEPEFSAVGKLGKINISEFSYSGQFKPPSHNELSTSEKLGQDEYVYIQTRGKLVLEIRLTRYLFRVTLSGCLWISMHTYTRTRTHICTFFFYLSVYIYNS